MLRKTVCGTCGADNAPEEARFCPNCGASLLAGGGTARNQNMNEIPLAAATPLTGAVPQVSATSVEETVEASRVTYDEPTLPSAASTSRDPPRASATTASTTTTSSGQRNAAAATAAPPSNDVLVLQSSPSAPVPPFFDSCLNGGSNSSSFSTGASGFDGGMIECANYFKNPTTEMLQRSKLQVMGGVLFVALDCTRKGKFTLPESVTVGRILGDVKIDLSYADFVHPTTIITVGAVLGGLKVTVPRGVRVETQGLGILGTFRGLRGGQTVHAGQFAPLVIVRGLSILTGVKVQVNENVPPLRIVE